MGDGDIFWPAITVEGCCTHANRSAVTSNRLISFEVEDAAPPAFAAAKPDEVEEAVAELTVKVIC